MIDTELVRKAKATSGIIKEIDNAWRDYTSTLKNSIFRVPFKGEYNARVESDFFLVEGFAGELLIDKLYYDKQMYQLKESIKHDNYRIFGVYDCTGDFRHFITEPVLGVHYLGMSAADIGAPQVCTGDISFNDPRTLEELQQVALAIKTSFRVINLGSLGIVVLPDEYGALRGILSNKDTSKEEKLKQLCAKKIITKIL